MGNYLIFSKSKYPVKRINIILLMFYCILLFGAIVGWRIYLFKNLPKEFLFIYVYVITLLYYIAIYYSVKKQFLQMEFISDHSKKCMNRTKKCLYYFFCFILNVVIFEFFSLKVNSSNLYNLWHLFFIGIVGFMLMNYQFIVGFGKTGYISGEGRLCYSEIDKIEEIKRVQTINGILVYSRITLFDNEVCYDKFLMEEYIFLVNRVTELQFVGNIS